MEETVTIKLPDRIIEDNVESFTWSLRGNDFNVKLSKEDAKAAYKELAKSKSIRDEVIDFIKTMDYAPTPSQYDFILYSIVRGSIQMYEKDISTEIMSNDEFDIAYEETLQNMYSYIRNRLEDPEVKGDYLSENRTNIK